MSWILNNYLFNLVYFVDANRANTNRMTRNVNNLILSSCRYNLLNLLLINYTFFRFTWLNVCYSFLTASLRHATLTPTNSSKINIFMLTITFLNVLILFFLIIFNLHQLPQTFKSLINKTSYILDSPSCI